MIDEYDGGGGGGKNNDTSIRTRCWGGVGVEEERGGVAMCTEERVQRRGRGGGWVGGGPREMIGG